MTGNEEKLENDHGEEQWELQSIGMNVRGAEDAED